MRVQIMVVEDEINVRNGLSNFIQELGDTFTVMSTAANGAEALGIMKQGAPHILLTDIRMPVMDGLTLIENVKREYPDVITAVLSGYADFSYAQQALRHGVTDYLLKPLKKDSLAVTLNRMASEVLKLPSGYSSLLHHNHKWDMPLIRAESKLLESIELGDKAGLAENKGIFFKEIRKRCHDDVIKIIPYYTDFAITLRKRLSHMEQLAQCVESSFDRLAEQLRLVQPLEAVEQHLSDCLEYYTEITLCFHKNHSADIAVRCKEIIQNHYNKNISLQDISNSIGVTAAHLSRIVHRDLGLTFTEYVTGLRMKKAADMLLHTDVKIMDIAKYVGYDNPEYFSRMFKRIHGETPNDYRLNKQSKKRGTS